MSAEPWPFLVAGLAIVVGAALQRTSGTGLGLVLGPTIAVLLGPEASVLLVNATGLVVSSLIMPMLWRDIDWRRAATMLGWAVPGVAAGLWLLAVVPPAVLTIAIGALVLVGLAVTFGVRRVPRLDGAVTTGAAGLLAGLLNASSGIPAPVLVIYSRFARWAHESFVASLQVIFLGMGVLTIGGHLALGALTSASAQSTALPQWWVAPLIVVSALVGLGLGTLLTRRIRVERARQLTIVLAALGGVAALVRGIAELMT